MSKPSLTMIAARARNGVIGHQNRMPWHLPEDLKHFRQQTMGHVVLLGRKTWESIGRPLPGRRMVVISRQSLTLPEGVELAASLDEAIARHATEDEIMVMGGAQIYKQTWSRADRLLLPRSPWTRPATPGWLPPTPPSGRKYRARTAPARTAWRTRSSNTGVVRRKPSPQAASAHLSIP